MPSPRLLWPARAAGGVAFEDPLAKAPALPTECKPLHGQVPALPRNPPSCTSIPFFWASFPYLGEHLPHSLLPKFKPCVWSCAEMPGMGPGCAKNSEAFPAGSLCPPVPKDVHASLVCQPGPAATGAAEWARAQAQR